MLPYPSLFGSLATTLLQVFLQLHRRCHTLLFSGHLQRKQFQICLTGGMKLPYPSLFGSLATKDTRISYIHDDTLPYPSLFGSLATEKLQMMNLYSYRCHTLLFSGRLQRAINDERYNIRRLPYPSLFGSLATYLPRILRLKFLVAIPFSFRVACNRNIIMLANVSST